MKHYCSKRDPQIKRALVFTKKISTLVTKGRVLLQIEKKGRASLGQGRGLCHVKTGLSENTDKLKIETGRYSKPVTPLENRICEKCFSDEIESEERLLLKCSFYYTSRRKLLETIKNNINHSNFDKLSFGDKFIWLLNSESKDILICMCDFLLKS
jgi:hypothetical protein